MVPVWVNQTSLSLRYGSDDVHVATADSVASVVLEVANAPLMRFVWRWTLSSRKVVLVVVTVLFVVARVAVVVVVVVVT